MFLRVEIVLKVNKQLIGNKELPRVCTRYEVKSPVFHLPLV